MTQTAPTTAPTTAAAAPKALATTQKKPLTPVENLKVLVNGEKFRSSLREILPKHLSAERQARILCTILGRNPKLAECDQASLFTCMLDCSAMGLEPDGRRAHLIPYGRTCTLIVDYKGLIDLMMRSGEVDFIDAYPVYANELLYDEQLGRCRFEIEYGSKPDVFHKPLVTGDRGEFVGAYAIAHLKGLTKPKFAWMTKQEIDSIRERSKASRSGPWVTDYIEMAKKTTVRRISKTMPLSYELSELLEREITHEHGVAGLNAPPLQPLRPTLIKGPAAELTLPQVEQQPDPPAENPPAETQPTPAATATPKQPAKPAAKPAAPKPAAPPPPEPEPEPEAAAEEAAAEEASEVEQETAQPADAPTETAKPAKAAPTVVAATEDQVSELEAACAREEISEEQLCAYATKKWRLSRVNTIREIADFAPRRVAQMLAEFDQSIAEIKAVAL